ncbi:MAG: nucleotidyltransferase family protein [Nitrospirae bacterium]|nr:nucleotidyltransferase family protein [Nitrospirota bacterium]
MMRYSEDKILIACARTKLDDKSVSEIKNIINSDLDWEYILRIVSQHSIGSLLYKNLKAVNAEKKVPKDVLNNLRQYYHFTVAKNLQLFNKLENVLKILNDSGIKIVLLKGTVLAQTVYKNIGLRPMCDIDFAVDFDGTENSSDTDMVRMSGESIRFKKENISQVELVQKIDIENPWLDVHYESLRGRDSTVKAFNIKGLYDNAIPFNIFNMNMLQPSPEHQLLHLIIHGDYFEKLIWLCDIAELVRCYKEIMDWQKVIRDAEQIGYKNLFFFQLYSARIILGAPVPDDVLRRLQPGRAQKYLIDRLIKEWKFQWEGKTAFNLGKPLKFHLLESLTFNRKEHLKRTIHRLFIRTINKIN